MRIAIATILIVWAAVFAAVVTEATPQEPAAAPAPTGRPAVPRSAWVLLERARGGWRQVRGPFAGAQACLHISDLLNNVDTSQVFDCDEASSRSAAQDLLH